MPLKNFIWRTPFIGKTKTRKTFHFKPVTVNEVFKHLKGLSRNKASGVDNLPPGFLKDIAIVLAKPLCRVINLSLSTGIVPMDFKIGIITPIYKNGPKQEMVNYRPITVLPVCSKILEKCIHNQLMCFLEENKLFTENQFGFRSRRNTEHAATLFTDAIRSNMNEGRSTGAIFIDLSKAFDTLSHSQIITNLKNYGIVGIENDLFTNYHFNRQQAVNFNKTMSHYEAVTCGVPQGSILGPLLFLISFNDVEESLQYCNIIMYADDTVIFTSGKSLKEIEESLTSDFNRIANWMTENELVINTKKGKTECMLFGTPQRTKEQTLDIVYQLNKIGSTNTYKYLGVKLDSSLQLTEHLSSTYKKASGRLYLLGRIRNQLTRKAASAIYNSLLLPLFTYCSILTCNSTNTYKNKLKRFEQRASKIIYKETIPTKQKSIDTLMKQRLCHEVYKSIHGLNCDNFKNYFELMVNSTRNKNTLIRLPRVKLESFKKSFSFYGAKIFNELPRDIRRAETRNEFLKLLYNVE